MNEKIKKEVLIKIFSSDDWMSIGTSKYKFGNTVVHVRFCSADNRLPYKYKFNINPNTLTADYELWICGSSENYYLLPNKIIKDIYYNPDTYVDNHHPNIRVISVDTNLHSVTYAKGGQSLSLREYYLSNIS